MISAAQPPPPQSLPPGVHVDPGRRRRRRPSLVAAIANATKRARKWSASSSSLTDGPVAVTLHPDPLDAVAGESETLDPAAAAAAEPATTESAAAEPATADAAAAAAAPPSLPRPRVNLQHPAVTAALFRSIATPPPATPHTRRAVPAVLRDLHFRLKLRAWTRRHAKRFAGLTRHAMTIHTRTGPDALAILWLAQARWEAVAAAALDRPAATQLGEFREAFGTWLGALARLVHTPLYQALAGTGLALNRMAALRPLVPPTDLRHLHLLAEPTVLAALFLAAAADAVGDSDDDELGFQAGGWSADDVAHLVPPARRLVAALAGLRDAITQLVHEWVASGPNPPIAFWDSTLATSAHLLGPALDHLVREYTAFELAYVTRLDAGLSNAVAESAETSPAVSPPPSVAVPETPARSESVRGWARLRRTFSRSLNRSASSSAASSSMARSSSVFASSSLAATTPPADPNRTPTPTATLSLPADADPFASHSGTGTFSARWLATMETYNPHAHALSLAPSPVLADPVRAERSALQVLLHSALDWLAVHRPETYAGALDMEPAHLLALPRLAMWWTAVDAFKPKVLAAEADVAVAWFDAQADDLDAIAEVLADLRGASGGGAGDVVADVANAVLAVSGVDDEEEMTAAVATSLSSLLSTASTTDTTECRDHARAVTALHPLLLRRLHRRPGGDATPKRLPRHHGRSHSWHPPSLTLPPPLPSLRAAGDATPAHADHDVPQYCIACHGRRARVAYAARLACAVGDRLRPRGMVTQAMAEVLAVVAQVPPPLQVAGEGEGAGRRVVWTRTYAQAYADRFGVAVDPRAATAVAAAATRRVGRSSAPGWVISVPSI
ncbi:hypothetical protein H9P43_003390 [Blastocladiella emersonii ATCC 22665]|nr:hypothetical protein H9P43_003390 [Blastocladiella emersonii ATCC 22665]